MCLLIGSLVKSCVKFGYQIGLNNTCPVTSAMFLSQFNPGTFWLSILG